jgi:hypothetical protein
MTNMEKKCLVIMPTSDPDGYAQGHFSRVYQYIIVPACKSAGFVPMRIDDPTVISSPPDVMKTIIDTDIAICDLSSNNADALYGFTIRYAINLPVVLIKDRKTNLNFDIQEFGAVEYDDSLRIDTVQNEIEILGVALKKTLANKVEVNSLLNRLNLGSSQTTTTHVTESIDLSENIEKKESLPVISPLPPFVGPPITQSEIDKLKVGDFLFHINYGKGEIMTLSKMAKDKVAKVQFDSGSKMLVLMTSGIWRSINS